MEQQRDQIAQLQEEIDSHKYEIRLLNQALSNNENPNESTQELI
jgi:hypothetical protein